MRKLASIVTVSEVNPIPDTDRLAAALVKGWKVVVAKHDFKEGDKAVYFEIDSALPNEDRYAALRDRCLRKFMTKDGKTLLKDCIRIRTVKIRGVISQGLLMPLDAFEDLKLDTFAEGTDLTDLLKVEHYDELVAALAPQTSTQLSGDAESPFPSWIPKTDEERIQNLVSYFTDESMKDMTFEVTEKADGSSVTMFFSKEHSEATPFGVCSRNLRLKPISSNGVKPLQWLMADKYLVAQKLQKYWEDTGMELALQGELVGPGIQSNRDLLTEHEWRVFKVWNITRQTYLSPETARSICKSMGLQYVTVCAENLPVFKKFKSVDDLLKFAEGKTPRGNEREGLVFKSNQAIGLSFKAVSNAYLLNKR